MISLTRFQLLQSHETQPAVQMSYLPALHHTDMTRSKHEALSMHPVLNISSHRDPSYLSRLHNDVCHSYTLNRRHPDV